MQNAMHLERRNDLLGNLLVLKGHLALPIRVPSVFRPWPAK
jgi:hypothetical protein